MVKLSVNVNKIATLRNSRGGNTPDLLHAVATCVEAGAPGITVHPRADERHITRQDALDVGAWLKAEAPGVEYNIEGDPRPDWLDLVLQIRPTQATLVPVRPGEITSEAGWKASDNADGQLSRVVAQLKEAGIRVSLFINPDPVAVAWAHAAGADRVELFTEPYARGFHRDSQAALAPYRNAASAASRLGLGVNAGHDLNLDNLEAFCAVSPLDEVSIGHALICDALELGLFVTVQSYLDCLGG